MTFALKGGGGGGSHPSPPAPHPAPSHVAPPQIIHHYVPVPVPVGRPHPYIPGYHPYLPIYHPWYHPMYVWPTYGNYASGQVSVLETVLVILLVAAIIGALAYALTGDRRPW